VLTRNCELPPHSTTDVSQSTRSCRRSWLHGQDRARPDDAALVERG